jgi:hypothetical protein
MTHTVNVKPYKPHTRPSSFPSNPPSQYKPNQVATQAFYRYTRYTQLQPQVLTSQISHIHSFDKWLQTYQFFGCDFNMIHISSMFQAAVRIYKQTQTRFPQDEFNSLVTTFFNNISLAHPRELSNTAWAFEKLSMTTPLLEQLIEESIKKIQDFNPQDLAITALAFAKAARINNFNPEKLKILFEQIEIETLKKIDYFNPQDLANTLEAFSILKISNIDLFISIANQILSKIKNFKPVELASVAFSFSHFPLYSTELYQKLFEMLANETAAKIKDFYSNDLSLLISAFHILSANAKVKKSLDPTFNPDVFIQMSSFIDKITINPNVLSHEDVKSNDFSKASAKEFEAFADLKEFEALEQEIYRTTAVY